MEGEGGYFRRADETRVWMAARSRSALLMVAVRDRLLSCATEGFDLADVTCPLVDKQGCVVIKTNAYSVPSNTKTL